MNIREALLKEHSKAQTLRIVNYIGNDEKKFAVLMNLFFNDEYRVVQRAAWSVSNVAEAHPSLIMLYLKQMIGLLDKNVHPAVKRNIVRILQFIEIPKRHYGAAAKVCFELLLSKDEPVAVKVFSMTVIANICRHEPGLKNELQLVIRDQLPFSSAGFQSRAKKVLISIEN